MTTWRFIDAEKANHSVVRSCSALSVSRAAYYVWKLSGSSARVRESFVVEVHLRAAWRASRGTYGAPRLTRELRESGFTISRTPVARRMTKNALDGLPKTLFTVTTDSANTEQVAPNLLKRHLTVARPNQAWVADIT